MKRAQDKNAERDFFNRGAQGSVDDHVFDKEISLTCFDLLGIGRDLKGVIILEAGCGPGDWGRLLALRNARVIGVDLADEIITYNKKLNADLPTYECLTGDLENTALFSENCFDAVTCFNVLHHFPDPEAVIRNLTVWLRDGGVLYAVEPNGGNIVNRMSKIIRKIIAPFMGKFIQKKGLATVNEVKDHSMTDYRKLFGKHGFVCDLKVSVPWTGEFPQGNLLNVAKAIGVVKWLLYRAANHFPGDPINRGNPLLFRMSLKKNVRG